MRLLLISQLFTPEPTTKGLEFALELTKRGYTVDVLTGFPNYPGGRIYSGYKGWWYQHEVIDGIHIHRVPIFPSHDHSAVKRVITYLSFALSASLVVNFVVSRPTVALVYYPSLTASVPAMLLRYLRGVPFVYDIQDLWPDSLAATGMMRQRWQLRVVSLWCDLIHRSASKIVVLSEGFRSELIARGVPDARVKVIYNWCLTAPMSPLKAINSSRPVALCDRFNVMFTGNFGRAQALDVVLDAAQRLRATAPNVQFVLVGSGVEEHRLKEIAAAKGLSNVLFIARVPAAEIGQLMQHADALLVTLRPDPLFELTIPSKTQSYMAAGRPIVMAVAGDSAELVRRANCGVTSVPGDAEALAEAVCALANLSPTILDAMGRAGADFYDAELSLQIGVGHFDKVFREVSGLQH